MEIYKSDISKDTKQPVSHTGGGSGIYADQGEFSVGGMNLATQTWIEDNYISKKFFNKLFLVHGDGTTLIEANDLSTAIESLEAKIGLWTNSYISALGQNSSQGGGSGTSYNRLDTWSSYDSTKSGWVLSALLGNDLNTRLTVLENGVAPISHTHNWSDITNTPTTLNGYGITDAYISNGVITLGTNTITPITSLAGYATEDWVTNNYSPKSHTHSIKINGVTKTIAATDGTAVDLGSYLPLVGGTMSNTNAVTNLNADLLDGYHEDSFAHSWRSSVPNPYIKFITITRNNDKGFIRLHCDVENNSGIKGADYIVHWGYDDTNEYKAIIIKCLSSYGSNADTSVYAVRKSGTQFDLIFKANSTGWYIVGFSVIGYSSCTINNYSIVSYTEETKPQAEYTSSATSLITDITGNASTATKATQDSDGSQINTTYLKRSGGTMTTTNVVTNLNADLLDGQHGSYYAKASDVSTLQGYFNNGVANNAYKVNGFHVLYTDFLYSYSKIGMLEQSAMSGDFWYAKIFLERGWEPSKSAIVLKSRYSDITGEVYLNLLSYAYGFNAYVTNYNGCNIVGIRINFENYKSVIYLKLKKPKGSDNGNIYYYGGYDATITVSATDLLGNGLTYFTLEAGKTYGVMANKLATARTIWGQSFDGTGNVSGNLTFMTGSNGMYGIVPNQSGHWDLSIYTEGQPRLTIKDYGNVGIGTSNPTEKLDVNGTIHATTGIYTEGYVSALGQNTSSDIRLKDVQGDVDLPIDMLANAPSKAFVWKGNNALGVQVGTIAQYWQKALPQVVHDNNGYLAMQYDVAALLGVISVAKKVKSHEERIAELERENKELKQELKELRYERN